MATHQSDLKAMLYVLSTDLVIFHFCFCVFIPTLKCECLCHALEMAPALLVAKIAASRGLVVGLGKCNTFHAKEPVEVEIVTPPNGYGSIPSLLSIVH